MILPKKNTHPLDKTCYLKYNYPYDAEVVELVDALVSGISGSNPVGVRVPPSALFLIVIREWVKGCGAL